MLNRNIFSWLAAFLIVTAAGTWVRLFPYFHNVSSDAYEEGTLLVIGKIRAMLSAQIEAQHPGMPRDQRDAIVNAKVNEVLRKDSAKAREAFAKAGDQINRHTGERKRYLQETDSYYWLNLTENIIQKGDVSDQVKGSRYFNPLMLAPLGFWEPQTWHPYVGAAVYRAARVFEPDIELMEAVGWTPVVLLPLVVAAFLFTCRVMGCGPVPSFLAALLFVLAPIFLKRSTYAWYDNDIYSVFFPVMTLGLFFLAARQERMLRWIAAGLCGLSLAIYSMFWTGWGFLPVLLAFSACLALFISVKDAPSRKSLALTVGALLAVCAFLVGFLYTWPLVGETIATAFGELKKFTLPRLKDWPDLFIVVGELKRSSLQDIVRETGGLLVSLGALTALAFAGWRWIRERKPPTLEIITLVVLLGATIVLSRSALRFTLLCLTPISLLCALGFNELWARRDRINVPPAARNALLTLLVILIAVFPVVQSQKSVRGLVVQIFNSAWDRALTKLREESPKDSIVNTWWSPGHFVKAIGQRRVTFDGASIKGEQAYWLNQVYLATNERDALGVLRMLNTSSNQAAEYLASLNMPLSTAVPLLREIVKLPRAQAQAVIGKVFPAEKASKLIDLTHGKGALPPSYVLVYNENLEGNVLLGYLGKWNFRKIEDLNSNPSQLRAVPAKSSDQFVKFIWELVGGPLRQSPTLKDIARNGSKVLFEGGVEIDRSNLAVRVNSSQYGQGVPQSVIYFDEASGQVVEKILDGANLSYSAVYFEDHGLPRAALMERPLANSLLVKMYYFEGKGLRHFKPFANERDLTGRTRVLIYEVAWPAEF